VDDLLMNRLTGSMIHLSTGVIFIYSKFFLVFKSYALALNIIVTVILKVKRDGLCMLLFTEILGF